MLHKFNLKISNIYKISFLIFYTMFVIQVCSNAQTTNEQSFTKNQNTMNKVKQIKIGELVFDCRVSGNEADELVILLHGFPESSFMWIDLMEDLSKQGFYCIAPNMRGYSKDARPKKKKDYQVDFLVDDVMQIAKSEGKDKFHLIGHDWGAGIGWKLVYDYPQNILSWTGMSVPHLISFAHAISNDDEQKKMSGYIRSFQWPFFPEFLIRRNDFKLFKDLWVHSSEAEVEDYLSIFREKKGLTAALNYYRANSNVLKPDAAAADLLGEINVPTLFIWGKNDEAIGKTSVENGHDFMKGYYKYLELDAGHWLIQSKYDEIYPAILEHLEMFK